MTYLPAKSIYRGYDIRNSGIVVRIFLNDTMVHYGEMSEEDAYNWIDEHKRMLASVASSIPAKGEG